MASKGPYSPTVAADSSAFGTVTWSNPDNIKAADTSYATAVGGGEATTHYLKATHFNFDIPAGATIDGIVVEIKEKATISPPVADYIVSIVKADGTIGTTNKARTPAVANTWLSTETTYISYGTGTTDKWGESWDADKINDDDFGVVLSAYLDINSDFEDATAYVNHIRITVYYTESAGGPANLKSYNTNLKANIKSINTNLIANVKSLNTNV